MSGSPFRERQFSPVSHHSSPSTADLAAELDRSRRLRDKLTQGTATSAALDPVTAIDMVRVVFDAVSLLLRPTSEAEPAVVDVSGAQPEERLARLWEEHRRALYPDSFRGVDIEGVELILLDADVAGLVQRELNGGLDDHGIAILWACIADLDKIVPLINSEYCGAVLTAAVSEVALPIHLAGTHWEKLHPPLLEAGTYAVDPAPYGPPWRLRAIYGRGR
ncbi:hypothetical protein [Kitasatospora sp. NBC_01539]|uniref:hypothetical protein n=1 Tax=Kitasatospora sp. NBC_01539 TaxID=2903577 RepID=UPI0038601991